MSVAVTTRVLRHSPQRGAAKLLLVVLADFAGAEGLCWPGIKTLADIINESERHTIRLLNQLEADGEIASKPGGGRGHMTMYAVLAGLTPPEQDTAKGVLQNTVIRNTVIQNSVLQNTDTSRNSDINSDILGRNSDMSGQETVTSSAETVTSSAEDERPITSPQRAKTAQNRKDIRMIRKSHDPLGSVRESEAPSAPPTPPVATPQELSPAEQLISEYYPALTLSEQQRQALADTIVNPDGWRYVLTLWRENGWKPQIGNMLDRYRKEAANEQAGSSAAPHSGRRLPGNISPTSEAAGYYKPERLPPGSPRPKKPWELEAEWDELDRQTRLAARASAA